MRAALALWPVLAALVPSVEAALVRRSKGEQRTGLLRHSKAPDAASVDAESKSGAQITKFGPGNCISTWRNEDGHCEVETHCKDHDISKYPVKFICIDNGGEKVRHVFAAGSFDPEEQFDTLIECKTCLAEKEEKIEVLADTPPPSSHGKEAKHEKKEKKKEEEDSAGVPLKELKEEVKELEGFMMSTSAELQKLNAKVYSKEFQAQAQNKAALPDVNKVGKKAAAEAVKPVKSFVHHNTFHHEERSETIVPQIADPVRVRAEAKSVRKAHRKRLANDEDDDARDLLVDETKKATTVASSLASALKTAEQQDDSVSASQPTKSPMALPKDNSRRSRVIVMGSDDDDDGDDSGDDEGENDDVPETADEEEDSDKPSFSALQQSKDDGDSEESESTGEGEEDDTGDDENSSEP